MNNCFVEVGSDSLYKYGQRVCGDVFLAKRIKEEGRTVAVLSDGLGSGIKAGVLATLTATMALKYISTRMDLEKASSVIMKTLPVCKERRISYATFTIMDIDADGTVDIMEYDNPSFLLLRENQFEKVDGREIVVSRRKERNMVLRRSRFQALPGDRIIFHTDGLNQSGMGKVATPLGWGNEGIRKYITNKISTESSLSARNLAHELVRRALENDGWRSGDDTTCGVVYFRNPRKLMVVTGPPVDPANDAEFARQFASFQGARLICGGTTSKIISRELERPVFVDLRHLHPEIPPSSHMEGVDLVTEGIITMTKALEQLESGNFSDTAAPNAAIQIVKLLLDNDEISFAVGTKINDANQINYTSNIELRQTIVKRLALVLEEKYLKKVTFRFF